MKIIKSRKTTLRGTLATTGSTFTLQDFVDSKLNTIAYSDFDSDFVVVFSQGTNIEMILCDGITQNLVGTATISVASNGRHLNPKPPYTGSSTGLYFTTGAEVIATNDPHTMSLLANTTEDNSFTGDNIFSGDVSFENFPTKTGSLTPTANDEFVPKSYADGLTYAGAPDANETTKGIVEMATDTEAEDRDVTGGTGAKLVLNPNSSVVTTIDEKNSLVSPSGLDLSSDNRVVDEGSVSNGASYTAITIAFVDSDPDTLTDSANGFITAGFRRGQAISITGSTSNNGSYTIKSVLAGVITLVATDSLTAEVAGDGVTIKATIADKVVMRKNDGSIEGSITAGFGGNGEDGDLVVSSGVTDIDLGGVAIFVKNYSKIAIIGTGRITFSNQHANGTIIILKSSGNVDLTSTASYMIDTRGNGASGAIGGTLVNGTSIGNNGTSGTNLSNPPKLGTEACQGLFGGGGNNAGGTTAGDGGATFSTDKILYANNPSAIMAHSFWITAGAGGAGGGSGEVSSGGDGGAGGAGANGGGALLIECAGYWNFTKSNGINVSGENGENGTSAENYGGASTCGGAGGGGGAGGFFLAIYNKLTSNAGSVVSNGGNGGNGGHTYANKSVNVRGGGGGGGGGGFNGAGGNGSVSTNNGSNGSASSTTGSGGTGGSYGGNSGTYTSNVIPAGAGGGGTAGEQLITPIL